MVKTTLLLLMVMLSLPDFATAFNYWSITASTSPAVSGAVTPPTGPDYYTSGATTNVITSTVTTADFTVNPAPTGYLLSYVAIDGIRTTPISGSTYRVTKGTRTTHTLSAVYAGKSYTISTSKTGSGTIDPTVTVPSGTSKTISMTAATGNRIASVSADGATLTGGDGVATASYTFSNIQSNKSISVTFAPVPAVTAIVSSSSGTIIKGASAIVDGSASTYSVTPTFTWSVNPAGATLTTAADGKSAVFSAPTVGTWTVQLTLSAAGAASSTASLDISTVSQAYYDSVACTSCHADRSPANVAGYLASAHATTATASCQGCHNPSGTLQHYFSVLHTSVSQTTFKFLDSSAGLVGTIFCANANCHSASQIAQSEAHGQIICGTCHNNSPHLPDPANAGVNNGVNATYCATCHGVSAQPVPELSAAHSLACSGCHGNVAHTPHIATGGVNASYCGSCHGVSANPIPALSAGHSTQCSACHGSSEHNPHTTDGIAAKPCLDCHNKPNQAHYFEIGTAQLGNLCSTCHSGTNHDPQLKSGVVPAHFNGYTSYLNPGYAAAYVTPATECSDCHKAGDATTAEDLAMARYREEWGASPHGDIKNPPYLNSANANWKASGVAGVKVSQAYAPNDCQRCHTSRGYVLFFNTSSITPLATADARYSEPITCNGCHNADFSPAIVSARTGYYNYSSAATGKLMVSASFPDSKTSNICIGCHTGRESGDTVKAMAAATVHRSYSSSFWNNVDFVSSHWLTAGGQVFGVTGYDYPGQNYSNTVDHSQVGSDQRGPCVTCHMPNKSHTRYPWASGYGQCTSCHDTGMDSTVVAAKTANFNAALQALGRALTLKGFAPNVVGGVLTSPYFTQKNWGNKDTGPANMGAAFNYNLLMHDPGAFAHNPTYAKRLVRDSLDYLTYGSVDRKRDLSATINGLLTNATDRADANAFLVGSANGSSACIVCHQDTPDPLTGDKIGATYNASLHATTPRDGGPSCASCHAPVDTVAHPPALTMLKDASAIAVRCAGCHVAVHTWPSEGVCFQCHNGHDPTPTASGYPHFSSFSSAQYVAKAYSCNNCHKQVDDTAFRVYTANKQWAKSGHGNPLSQAYVGPGPYTEANLEAYDFKFLGTPAPAKASSTSSQDCVRCHTASGFVDYVTPTDTTDENTIISSTFSSIKPWGVAGDRSREMISCPACHNLTSQQLDSEFSRRSVGVYDSFNEVYVVRAWYNYSSSASKKVLRGKSFLNPSGDMADSNICIACHTGKAAGDVIKEQGATCGKNSPASIVCRVGNGNVFSGMSSAFWKNAEFIDPHGGPANFMFTGTLKPGYEYRSTGLSVPEHMGIGDETQGPCVGCHMTSPEKHSFSVLSTASNGVISAIRTDACLGCHTADDAGVMTVEDLQSTKENYNAALAIIKAKLAERHIYYNAAKAPYFFSTDETTQQSASTRTLNWSADPNPLYRGANMMGAAFNLRLLDSDAAWIHHPQYAKRLLYDTIDYLDNGAMGKDVILSPQSLHDYLYPR